MRKLLIILPLIILAACGPTIVGSSSESPRPFLCSNCPTVQVTNNVTSADYLTVSLNAYEVKSRLKPSETYTLSFRSLLFPQGYPPIYTLYIKGYKVDPNDSTKVLYVGMQCATAMVEFGYRLQPWIVSNLRGLNDKSTYCGSL